MSKTELDLYALIAMNDGDKRHFEQVINKVKIKIIMKAGSMMIIEAERNKTSSGCEGVSQQSRLEFKMGSKFQSQCN